MVENLGAITVPPAAGLIAARLGLAPVLVGVAVLAAAAVSLTARIDETLPQGKTGEERPSPLEGLRFMARPEGCGAALMTVISLVAGFGNGLLPPIWGLYVTDRFGVGYAGLGAVSISLALAAGLGQLIGGTVADRMGHARLMALSFLATIPAWALMTLAGRPWVFSLLTVGHLPGGRRLRRRLGGRGGQHRAQAAARDGRGPLRVGHCGGGRAGGRPSAAWPTRRVSSYPGTSWRRATRSSWP